MLPLPIQHDELLATLNSFGTDLPSKCSLPVEELEKRLIKALHFSQRFDELFRLEAKKKLDPHEYHKWTNHNDQKVAKAMQRLSVEETVMGSAPISWDLKLGAESPNAEIFTELKHTMMGLGHAFDIDSKSRVYFVGADKDWLIEFQTLSVHKVAEDTPLILFCYNHQVLPERNALEKIPTASRYNPVVVISELERKVLLALWDHNGNRLATVHHKKVARKAGDYKASFVLPLGSIGMRELGSLSKNTGCVICGQANSPLRCDKCLSVIYCSERCQTVDWQLGHKDKCVTLQDATWHRVVFHDRPDGVDMGYTTMINRKDQIKGANFPALPVSNARGPSVKKTVLVKMQTPGIPGVTIPDHIMIYDRQRSFRKFWVRSGGPSDAAFRVAVQQIHRSGGKVYRWLKRIDDNEYEVCLDRVSPETPVW
ncbi:hypothetical protein CVT24_009878 [Panaeolus cyanescens]|uniref:MYND-type domain-containing protein n=1 Tax=Panaeolus cyanescens TaxID=181874 RepID=A0A409WU67_9AGAR|nr:hypothetical protein CVT24_009878 [Panaeolus cyanescens]